MRVAIPDLRRPSLSCVPPIVLPVVREIESVWQAHLGAARTRELRRTLEALREITDPFAEPKVADPGPCQAARSTGRRLTRRRA